MVLSEGCTSCGSETRAACRAPLDRCRAPGGGRLELPFVCPMDHIFQQAHFADSPELHGPPLLVREHSFLENPAVPSSVMVSKRCVNCSTATRSVNATAEIWDTPCISNTCIRHCHRLSAWCLAPG